MSAGVAGAELRDELGAVEAGIVGNNGGQLAQGTRERLHGDGLLARRGLRQIGDGVGHEHLGAAAAVHNAWLAHRRRQHAQSVVQRSLGLVEYLLRGAAQHDGARLAERDAAELEQLVLADHDLLDEVAVAELDTLRVVECGDDLAAEHERQALDALEVGVLDGHDARVGEQLLGVVVDELTVDEDVGAVLADALHLLLHLLLLGELELGHLGHRVDLDARAEHLDLVGVHGRVGDEDLGVLDASRLVDAGLLVEQEALVQIRVGQVAAELLDDLNGVQVAAALETEDGLDRQTRVHVLVLGEDLRAERGARYVHQILLELVHVLAVVDGVLLEHLASHVGRAPPAGNDRLRMDLLRYELLGLLQIHIVIN